MNTNVGTNSHGQKASALRRAMQADRHFHAEPAVFMFTTSSKWVGCSTGMSADAAPLVDLVSGAAESGKEARHR